MTEYISNDDTSIPKRKPTITPIKISDYKLDLKQKITGYKGIAISERRINYKSNWWHVFHLSGNSNEDSKLRYGWNNINRKIL